MFADKRFNFSANSVQINKINNASETYDMQGIPKREFEINIESSGHDYYVDFYVIFVKENNDVYLDGIMHSTDTTRSVKRYLYHITHSGSKGIIEYYVVPFLKNGNIGTPTFLAAHEIQN